MEQFIPNIITGLVSIVAIGFAYYQTNKSIRASERNLERQLKVQLRTTVEKEWIENVRKHCSDVVYNAQFIMTMVMFNGGRLPEKEMDSIKGMYSSVSSLQFFLDSRKPLENAVLTAVKNVADYMSPENYHQFDNRVFLTKCKTLSTITHDLFSSFRNH